MKQLSMTDVEYGQRKCDTKRSKFLAATDEIIPWTEWIAFIEPYCPTGERGRKPLGIEKMLRMYILQCWFNLSIENYRGFMDNHCQIHKNEAIPSYLDTDPGHFKASLVHRHR